MSSKLKKALLILISIALTIGLSIFAWKKLDNSIIGKNIDKTGLDSETLKEIQYEEVTEAKYNLLMGESNRGDAGFGSSDVKH